MQTRLFRHYSILFWLSLKFLESTPGSSEYELLESSRRGPVGCGSSTFLKGWASAPGGALIKQESGDDKAARLSQKQALFGPPALTSVQLQSGA